MSDEASHSGPKKRAGRKSVRKKSAARKKATSVRKKAAGPRKKAASARKKTAARKSSARRGRGKQPEPSSSLFERLANAVAAPWKLLPSDSLDSVLPMDALRRIAEVGLIDFAAEHVERRVSDEPAFQRDHSFLETLVPMMHTFSRYFDAEVQGWENVPEEGGMLVVGNHSGGTLVPDTAAFISAWYRERGMESTLMGLAFDAMFGIPGVESLMRRIGQIPATPENAARALDEGAAVLVYPGGAHEAFRPWRDRNEIDFAGRTGFIKLALRKGVPVVPVVGHGGQESVVILARGDSVGRRLGFDRLRTTVAPLMWQVPWGVSIPMLPGVPLPAKISMEILSPMEWSQYGPDDADDPVVLERCYEEITGRMQATLTRLAEEHPYPVAERLWRMLPGTGG